MSGAALPPRLQVGRRPRENGTPVHVAPHPSLEVPPPKSGPDLKPQPQVQFPSAGDHADSGLRVGGGREKFLFQLPRCPPGEAASLLLLWGSLRLCPTPTMGGGAEDPLRLCARGRFGGGVSSSGRRWSPALTAAAARTAAGPGSQRRKEPRARPPPPRLSGRRAPPRRPARPRAAGANTYADAKAKGGRPSREGGGRMARACGSARLGGGEGAEDGAIQGFSCSHCPAELPPRSEASLKSQVTYALLRR